MLVTTFLMVLYLVTRRPNPTLVALISLVQEGTNFGLDESNVVYEKYPLVYQPLDEYVIKRIPTAGSW